MSIEKVLVISFRHNLNMVKKNFVKQISFKKGSDFNEDGFVENNENNCMILITSKFTSKFSNFQTSKTTFDLG